MGQKRHVETDEPRASIHQSRFAHVGRWKALITVLIALAMMGWGFATPTDTTWRIGNVALPDLSFYGWVVSEVHSGRSYYDSVATVMTHPKTTNTASVFNWRLPTYAWLLGALPEPEWGFPLLIILAFVSVVLVSLTIAYDRTQLTTLATTVLLLGGTFAWCLYDRRVFYATEPWCEVLLLLSLCAYARGWWVSGVILGLAALCLRELTLPYCLASTGLAMWHKRWREVAVWVAGMGMFIFLLWLHGREVSARAALTSLTEVSQWVPPGAWGLDFILISCQMNMFLRLLPSWIIAMYLPLALLGLAGWNSAMGARIGLVTLAYAVPFLVVRGWSYWGFFYSPLLLFGIVRAPIALKDLYETILGRRDMDPNAVAHRHVVVGDSIADRPE